MLANKYHSTPEAVEQMIVSEPVLSARVLLSLLYGCGLRLPEALAARWDDTEDAGLRLVLRVRRRGGDIRAVEVPADCAATLRAARRLRNERTDTMILADAHGRPIGRVEAVAIVRHAATRAGLGDIRQPHDLRLIAVQHRMAAGATPEEIATTFDLTLAESDAE